MTGTIKTSVSEGVASLWLDRPKEMNALDAATAQAIIDALKGLAADPKVRVLVLGGSGLVFSAGGDFNWVLSWPKLSEQERQDGALVMMGAIQAVQDFPKPSIARVHGSAVGGGVGLMLACDYAVAASTARFGLTSARNGLLAAIAIPGLLQAVGRRKTRQLLLHGGLFDAAQALEIGLIDRVVPAEALDAEVATLAKELTLGAPSVQKLAKELVAEIDALPHDADVVRLLAGHVAAQSVTEEAIEGMSAFLAKRKPKWAI
ncbi:MAG TPA: enoyl-CoA hydratase-related protein [Reyranella sp.]|nr:enoyl-CoA hydratase-related protein [Reyranella sp.]